MIDQPAQARDAEVSLLGACMSGYRDVPDLLAKVTPDDFYWPNHGDIWRAITTVIHANHQPDIVAVRHALDAAGVRHDPVALHTMVEMCPLVTSADYYAAKVIEAAGHRALQAAGTKITQLGSTPGDLAAHQEAASAALQAATVSRGTERRRTLSSVLYDVVDAAQAGNQTLLPTGWDDVDRILGGLAPGRLVTVGARPGVGKSLFATNLALHFGLVHKRPSLIASMEMPEMEVGQRLLAAMARVSLSGLQDGSLDESSWGRVADSMGTVDTLPIEVDDTPTQTVTHIARAAREAARTHGPLALILVDYLQLIRPTEKSGNRAEDLGEISRGLKLMARDTGACVVAMAQVNREGTRHTDGRPRMTDLRESGAIEADSDQVILLHQPDDALPEIEVIVDKNRHRGKGIARLHLQGHYARLVGVAWDPTRAAR